MRLKHSLLLGSVLHLSAAYLSAFTRELSFVPTFSLVALSVAVSCVVCLVSGDSENQIDVRRCSRALVLSWGLLGILYEAQLRTPPIAPRAAATPCSTAVELMALSRSRRGGGSDADLVELPPPPTKPKRPAARRKPVRQVIEKVSVVVCEVSQLLVPLALSTLGMCLRPTFGIHILL